MYTTDLFKQILFSLWSHKIRTCAALFGIVWGTITIVLLLALSNGFYAANVKNLAFLNNGTIFAWAGTTSKSFAGLPEGRKIHFQIKDLLEIVQDIPGIKSYSPVYSLTKEFHYKNKHINASLQGVAAGYDVTQQLTVNPGGRFIDELDVQQKNYVVFLDDSIKKVLFGNEDAIHQRVMIQGLPFTVIGVANPENNSAVKFMRENNAFIPYTTFLAIFGSQDIHLLFITPESNLDTSRIKQNLKNMLAMKLHYDPTDDDAFHVPDLEDAQQFMTWFFRIVELFLLFCGVLTLSVGGLGTANMMFLIVTERTREIGLRMALGAEQSHIMMQFILESFFLVGFGGLLGAIISGFIIFSLRQMQLPEWLGIPYVSVITVGVTVIILTIVGLMAGYFPARRAANMEPIKALAF